MKLLHDKAASENPDILGRSDFAKEIAKGLINYSKKNTDGITISISGEWGSGKSTLLKFLKTELEQTNSNNTKVIEFNPWILYKEGVIREAFLIHFALALKGTEEKITAISKKVKDFVTAFRFLKNISAFAGNVQGGVEAALEFFANKNSIPEIKKEIEKALLNSKKKIFILIDDIDRLTQEEMLELLQTISLVMNFPNVYYIIAFDKDIVINAINKEYSQKGSEYLEKIIQIDYPLPTIRKEKLESMFFQLLSDINKEYRIKFDDSIIKSLWGFHGLSEYFTTMRDYKRFFNSLSFRLPVIAEDVNVHDFIAIEAIRLFDNDGYNYFYSLYLTNLRKRDVPEAIFKEDQLKQFKQPTGDIIKAIFPKSTLEMMRTDTNLKRIYDSAYFERYFSLLRNEKDISESDFKEFMMRPEARNSILADAVKHNRIKNLLRRLTDDNISKHFPKYGYNVVEAVMIFFGSNCIEFQDHHMDVSNAIINLIIRSQKRTEYIKKFFLSFKGHTGYPSIIHIYFFHFIRLFHKEKRGFGSQFYEFNQYFQDNFDSIYSWYIDSFEKSASPIISSKFTMECPFFQFLYLLNLAELFPDTYLTYQKTLLKDKYFLLYILSQFIWLTENLQACRYDLKYKDLLFPVNTFIDFYNAVKGLDKVELDDKQRAFIDEFLKIDVSNYPEIKIPD